jgi:hypothetical protein
MDRRRCREQAFGRCRTTRAATASRIPRRARPGTPTPSWLRTPARCWTPPRGREGSCSQGFLAAYDHDLNPAWRESLLRITRQRLELHRHPDAVARALREVPRSVPFDGLDELEFLDVPALVVASHDEADPGHPYAIAQEWAERLPQGRLISEAAGESPLAWQGGKLSREIAAFCERPEVVDRVGET